MSECAKENKSWNDTDAVLLRNEFNKYTKKWFKGQAFHIEMPELSKCKQTNLKKIRSSDIIKINFP